MRTIKRFVVGMLAAMVTGVGLAKEAAPDAAPFSASLVGHWRLDETAGLKAVDEAGKHEGTFRGGVRWVKGRFGGAASFNGRDGLIALGDLGKFAEATISFWMRARNVGKEDYQGLVTSLSWEKNMLPVHLRSSAYASCGDSPGRYGRSEVIASKARTTFMMRLAIGIFLPEMPRG